MQPRNIEFQESVLSHGLKKMMLHQTVLTKDDTPQTTTHKKGVSVDKWNKKTEDSVLSDNQYILFEVVGRMVTRTQTKRKIEEENTEESK